MATGLERREEAARRPLPAVSAPGLLGAVRVGGIALLIWALSGEVGAVTPHERLAAWLLVASVVPAWVAWSSGRSPRRLELAALAWIATAGGAVAGIAPIGLALVGAAALGAATACELPPALGLTVLGPAALGATVAFDGRSPTLLLAGAAAGLAGLVLGAGRRQYGQRAEQAVRVAFERDRAEVERDRAEVLAERNRLAREMHDVLAHTLGALSVQLEALDARLDGDGGAPQAVRDGVRRTKALASEGLAEARRAVRALRDDAVPLTAQLERLCELRGAELAVEGDPRALPPEATLALYRVAQEGLTNAAKHAPGASTTVRLRFDAAAVGIAVENGAGSAPPGELAGSGAGYGLDGIRERLRLLGGEVSAAPKGDGWLVTASLSG